MSPAVFGYLCCGTTVAAGAVVAQVPAPEIPFGQNVGSLLMVGGAIGAAIAAAIASFGTNIWPKPWLEQRGYLKRMTETLELAKANSEKIGTLEKAVDAAESKYQDLVVRTAHMVSLLTNENLHLIHQLLVLKGIQKPTEFVAPDHSLVIQGDGPRVLLVEDDPMSQAAMTQALRRNGFRVDLAENFAEACAGLERAPDFVVLDLMFPGGRGEDVLRKVRADGLRTRVVVVTAKLDVEEARTLGPAAIVGKPFDLYTELLPHLGVFPKGGR